MASSTALQVLVEPHLYQLITSFMPGVPHLFVAFYHNHPARICCEMEAGLQRQATIERDWKMLTLINRLHEEGRTFKSKCLQFDDPIDIAVEVGDLVVLEWQLNHWPANKPINPSLMGTAVRLATLCPLFDIARRSRDIPPVPSKQREEVAHMLWEKCPNVQWSLDENAVLHIIEYGPFELLEWVHAHVNKGFTQEVMHRAACIGKLDMVRFLHENRTEGCSEIAMDVAAREGHLEVLQFLYEHRREGYTDRAMNWAASRGHINVIQYMHEQGFEGWSPEIMDEAASAGHLDVVKFLQENRNDGCTTDAMNWASFSGHLDVVKYLHEHRTEGCTSYAMTEAAGNGHLPVVQFLHENRTEGNVQEAHDTAKLMGHVKVVEYLQPFLPPTPSS